MAFRSLSDGAPISPYQQSFGTPGQTKVSGDRQRETIHEVCCLAAEWRDWAIFKNAILVLRSTIVKCWRNIWMVPRGSKRSLVKTDRSTIWWWSERHLTVLCINEVVPSHVVIRLNEKVKIVVKCLIIATARLYNCLTSIWWLIHVWSRYKSFGFGWWKGCRLH